MIFGKVAHPQNIDFTLPKTHPKTFAVLSKFQKLDKPNFFIGCSQWNKAELKGFYPKGTKDELKYYSKQFNCVELNATFYQNFSPLQFEKWRNKTPDNFKFFPKLGKEISHWKRLYRVEDIVNAYIDHFSHLRDKLGTIFLQLPEDFSPNQFKALQNFVESWPKNLPLAIEVRHKDWYVNKTVFEEFTSLLEVNNIANVLVDTAGRRDMIHNRLTNNETFIRYVGANHPTDYDRLEDWVYKLREWTAAGLQNIHFFIHQNLEQESPLLATHFIKKVNDAFQLNIKIPDKKEDAESNGQISLF